MHNYRIPRRPLLGNEDARHGGGIEGVGAQSVYGLGGKGHEATRANDLRGAVERILRRGRIEALGIETETKGLHKTIFAAARATRPARLYSQIMVAVETEIKFRVGNLADLDRKLQQSGFHLDTPRTFESNVLYDTADRRMRARTEIVRIRTYGGKTTLTHKRLPDQGPGEDRHKHRVETETEVSDGKALAEVFQSLGLIPAFRYEKWRTEWSDGEGHCVVDETPIGNFAELEGEPAWIDRVAARLGVPHTEYMTLSYGRLFEQWREEHHSPAEHLTFEAVGAGAH